MKLLVAIPALNEADSIASVISQIENEIPQAKVLVIDDGSKDETSEIAKSAGAEVITMPFNVGVGGALRVAFKYAKLNAFTHVLQIDADGQHLPSEAIQLLDRVTEDSIVIGSRFLDKSSTYKASESRRLAMKLLAAITGFICKSKFTDVTSGFRIASGSAIDLFAANYPREYLGDTVESIILAHRAGIPVQEVAVSMKPREFGAPSQNFIKSSWYLLRALLMITLAIFKKK